jgi:hypothetical protein
MHLIKLRVILIKKLSMKKLLFTIAITLFTATVFGQVITDTAAFIKQSGPKDYIMLDGKLINDSFGATFSTSFFNQKIILTDNSNQPFMLLSLPVNGSHTPAFGTYNIMGGKKLAVKKGSQIAKVDMKPNYISTDNGGAVTIFEFNELHWFFADNITVINTDTQETHKLSFKISMFIEKR